MDLFYVRVKTCQTFPGVEYGLHALNLPIIISLFDRFVARDAPGPNFNRQADAFHEIRWLCCLPATDTYIHVWPLYWVYQQLVKIFV